MERQNFENTSLFYKVQVHNLKRTPTNSQLRDDYILKQI